jgi:hypothetical protein
MSFQFSQPQRNSENEKVTENVNIYMKNDSVKDNILKDCSSYEKYIILMNESLQNENKELNITIKNLEKQISEYEEEVDRYDISKRYTKGLLKNLVELEKMRNRISENNDKLYSQIRDEHNKIYKNNKFYMRFYELITLIIFSVFYEIKIIELTHFIIFMFFIIINFYMFEKINKKIEDIKCVENDELFIKIKKINDSQDFLNDYIDNI